MLTKESKITVLENFYGIDYALFGKSVSQVESCCPLLKEDYLAIKGALLSVYIEMLKLIEHEPSNLKEFVDSDNLKTRAKGNARIAREYAERIVKSTKARHDIKESLKEAIKENANIDVSYIVENVIRQKAMALAVDSLLIAKALNESVEASNLNTWEGKLLEDSYKILRDNLIESAWQITDTPEEVPVEEMSAETKNKLKAAGKGAVIGGVVGSAAGLAIRKLRCKKLYKDDPEKAKACFRKLVGKLEPKEKKD
ncbi:MAG: hypothetical protein ACTSX1_09310 [Candidatus Heimdallarchaeaceae archaeon]